MNSLKFLAFGKSWATGREVIGRFRMREDCLLPRFEEEHGAAEAVIVPKPAAWWRRLGRLFGFRRRIGPAVPAVVPEQLEAGADASPLQVASPGDGTTTQPEVIPAGLTPANPFAAAVNSPAETPEPSATGRGTSVQREFRFEHVTVVCNDLHDADVEVGVLSSPRRRPARTAVVEQPALLNA